MPTDYDVSAWVALIVVGLTVWRAFHGPHSDEWWSATTHWVRERFARR